MSTTENEMLLLSAWSLKTDHIKPIYSLCPPTEYVTTAQRLAKEQAKKSNKVKGVPIRSLNSLLLASFNPIFHAIPKSWYAPEGTPWIFATDYCADMSRMPRLARNWLREEFNNSLGEEYVEAELDKLRGVQWTWSNNPTSLSLLNPKDSLEERILFQAIPNYLAQEFLSIPPIQFPNPEHQLKFYRVARLEHAEVMSWPPINVQNYESDTQSDKETRKKPVWISLVVKFYLHTIPGRKLPLIYNEVSVRRWMTRPLLDKGTNYIPSGGATAYVFNQYRWLDETHQYPTFVPLKMFRGTQTSPKYHRAISELIKGQHNPLPDPIALASCPAPEDGWRQPEPQVVYAAIAYSSNLRGNHPCQPGVSPLDVALIDAAIANYLPVDRVGVGMKVKGLRRNLYWQPGAPHPKDDPSPRNPNELSVVMHRPDMASVATFSSSRPLKTVLILWKNQQTKDALIKEIRALLKLDREGEKTEYKTSTGATAYSVVYSGDEGSLRIKSQHVEDLINPLDLSDPKLKLPENANRDERRQKAMDKRIALFHKNLPVCTEPSAALIEIEEKETYESKYVDPYLATRIGSMQKGYVNQRINPVRNEEELQAASTSKKTGKVNQKVLEEETKRDESRVRSAVGGLLMQCGVLPIPLIDNKDKGISSATWLTCCYVLRRTKKTTVDRIPNTAVIMVRVNSVSGLIEFTTPKLKLEKRGWVDSWEIYHTLLDEKWDVNSYYEVYPEQVLPEESDDEFLKEQHLINHFIAEALKETLSTPIGKVPEPHVIFMAEAQNARKLVKWLTNDPNFKSNVLPPAIKRHFEQESVMQRLSVIRMRVAERREVPMWVWQDKPGEKHL